MTIREKTSETEIYCRYLDADLFHPKCSDTLCNGRLGEYLRDEFNLKNLPYQVNIADLISEKIITPSLLIKFPKDYFENWANFPNSGKKKYKNELTNNHILADKHKVERFNVTSKKLFHPFDLPELKNMFVKKFKSSTPTNFELKTHNNGLEYIEYKAYFNYWIGYILIETLDEYEYIDKFLPTSKGKHKFFEKVLKTIDKRKSITEIFDKLSYYKTARAILVHLDNTRMPKEKSDLLVNGIENISLHHLECDLEKLLILYQEWSDKLLSGKCIYQKALEQLKRDIYILFEWLCISSNKDKKHYFEKWSYIDKNRDVFAELCTVINYEEFELKRVFLAFSPCYSRTLYINNEGINYEEAYNKLISHESFKPWLRSFKDLHSSLNPIGDLDYNQLRVLDCLLVITIRTEVVIRSICERKYSITENFSLMNLFKKLKEKLKNESKEYKMLDFIYENKKKTRVENATANIFQIVNDNQRPKKLNKLIHENSKSILKFLISRNYFAHKSYIDEEINKSDSKLATEILTSCVESLIIIQGYTEL